MPFEFSSRVTQALDRVQKTPSVVLLFDGISTPFTSIPVKTYYLLDDGFLLDDGLFLDRLNELADQITAISFTGGNNSTSTKIDYKIDPDLGLGDSITTMKISLVNDKKNSIINVLDQYELLGRKVRVKITADAPTALYPKDYTTVFRGIVDEVNYEAGKILISLSHPDQKKRQTIFVEGITELSDDILAADTSIPVENTAAFYLAITGPDSTEDASFQHFVRIEDEIIHFTDVTSTHLTGCTRGVFGTTAVDHDAEGDVSSYYTLDGNPMDIALKIMLSGWGDYFVEDVPVLRTEATNVIVFNSDIMDEYGLTTGDYITTTGALDSANNESLKTISSISYDEELNETTVLMNDVVFSYESETGITASFRSKYDTLPSGLRMSPDEVDVLEHEELKDIFLFAVDYSFYLKTTIDSAKDFLNKEIYQPIACFSVPRNTRASVGYTIPPLPDEQLVTLNRDNVKDPHKIKQTRQIGRNFYNSIIYKYDEDELEEEFNKGLFVTDADSRERIPVGNKVFTIESKGLRAGNTVTTAADRRITRYRFAAAQLQSVKTNFGIGFGIDIGDNIYFDGDALLIPDIDRDAGNVFGTRLFQVIQKTIDIKTGNVEMTLLDTNFSINSRYGYISPSSYIGVVVSDHEFILATSYHPDGAEYTKWEKFVGATVQIRKSDWSSSATGVIKSVGTDNTITLENDLSITVEADMIMEFADYDVQTLDGVKNLYTHMTDGTNDFADGGAPYYMI